MPKKKGSRSQKALDDGPRVFQAEQHELDQLHRIGFRPAATPRYLFRVHDFDSLGATSTSVVSSGYVNKTQSNQKNLFLGIDGPSDLFNHLKWVKNSGASNLVSWTSSLLFAIQLGLYKHKSRPVSQAEDDLSKVFILMIDTTKFPRGTFIRDKDAMQFFRHNRVLTDENLAFHQMRSKSDTDALYFGEYLAQGRFSVEGKCSQTSLQKLIDHGIYEFCPYFEQKKYWNGLASRVVNIRQRHFYVHLADATFYQPNERTAGRRAVTMAQACFGDSFALPFALMILAMAPVTEVTQVLFSSIIGMFSGTLLTLARNSRSQMKSLTAFCLSK